MRRLITRISPLLLAAVLSFPTLYEAGAGIPPVAEGGVPTLAPLLEQVTPAVVNIADRKSTRLNSSHIQKSRMPSSA